MAMKTVSDRLSFSLPNGSGDVGTIYGRLDMSDFIDPTSNRGVIVHDVQFNLRNPAGTQSTLTNTGMFSLWENMPGTLGAGFSDNDRNIGVKLVALNTAYQDLAEIGISTDGIYCIQEHNAFQSWHSLADVASGVGAGYSSVAYTERNWSVSDLHGDGALLLSDLLIGIATDNLTLGDGTAVDIDIEVDVVVHFTEKKVTNKEITAMITANLDV